MTITAFCLAMALAGAREEVVARVDGAPLSRADVEERASEFRSRGAPSAPEEAVESLAVDVLFSREARRVGLADDAGVRARIEREKRRAAKEAFLEKELAASREPSEAVLLDIYHSTADSVRLQMLAFPAEDAARVSFALVQRSGRLEDATRSAVPGFAVPGGDAPRFRGAMPPALAAAAFGTPVGAIGGPVEIASGWAIFKVLERKIGDEREFAAKRASIAQFARRQMAEVARQHARERFRAKARVVVDDAFLTALGNRREVTPAEMGHVVATVNGNPLRYGDIDPSLRKLSAASGHGAGPKVRRDLIMSEIDERLLEDAAIAKGFGADPLVVARVPLIERRLLAAAFAERVGSGVPPPSEKEVRAFYRANVERTGRPFEDARSYIAAHLVEKKRGEALQAKARELLSRANVVVDRNALKSGNRE